MNLQTRRQNERGNILFLILLAVVLFAALSYAVTQSMRGGGGNAGSETNLVNSAVLSQYPVGLRAAILRMIVDGTDVTTLNFDPPSVFSTMTDAEKALGVFHPDGGGASFGYIPTEALATPSSTARWIFTRNFGIEDIGATATTSGDTGKDIIAIAPGISQSVCAKINEELGVSSIPEVSTTLPLTVAASTMQQVEEFTYSQTSTVAEIADTGALIDGQPFLCVDYTNGTGENYAYYHVLVER